MAINVFDTLEKFQTKWGVKDVREFTEEEKKCVLYCQVVSGNYSNAVQFTLFNGYNTYMQVKVGSKLAVGDVPDINDLRIYTLSKPGSNDILRVDLAQ